VTVAVVLVTAGSSPATGAPGSGAARRTNTAAGRVDIGNGRELYLQCRGRGSPTVVLVSGTGGAHDEWTHVVDTAQPTATPKASRSAVFPQVARFTRVCAYDRPGTALMSDELASSTPVAQPRAALAGATDLRALLRAAGEPGPYVLVGASWGGMIVNLFARDNASKVAGLVFVDGASDLLKDALTPEQWAAWMQLIAATPPDHEAPDYESSVDQIRAAPPLPAVPAVVLTADKRWDLPLGDAGPTWDAWLSSQGRLAEVLHAEHVTDTNSSHGIAVEDPKAVVDAVRRVVRATR
jgi:pimeloyl-ACP methyl ester carboxylesterase